MFLQYDTDKYGTFGKSDEMKPFMKRAGFKLVKCSVPIRWEDDDKEGTNVLLIWRKA